ncbi:MAG: TPM domain-containing protein [Clostridia bacterium]|nr:TPM domain-containing protein [Clostridia bacterium]
MKKRIMMLVLALMLAVCAFADVVQPIDDFYYLDEAEVLSEPTEGEIFFANERLREACGAEIVVVAIDTVGKTKIDDYCYQLLESWGIGGDDTLGLVLLMAIGDDDYYCMPGTRMGTLIDTATISNLLDSELEPYFADKKYDEGVVAFFEAIYAKVAAALKANVNVADAKADYQAFVGENTQTTVPATTGGKPSTKAAGTQQPVANRNPAPAPGGAKDDDDDDFIYVLIGLLIVVLIPVIIVRSIVRSVRRRYYGGYYVGPRPFFFHHHHHHMAPPPHMHHGPGGPGSRLGGPGFGGRPTGGGFSGSSRPTGGGFGGSSRPTGGGFGGSSRSSGGFGGFSGGSRSSGGFGGASRGGGSRSGGFSRGGGAGRGGRH